MTESVSTLENHSSSRADWLRELQETVARRTEAEQAYLTQFASGIDPQHDALKRVLAEVVDEQERHETNLRERFDQQRREIEQQFRDEHNAVRSAHEAAVARIRRETQQETERIQQQYADSRWVATSVLDDTADESPRRQFERIRVSLDNTRTQQQTRLEALQAEVHSIAEARGWSPDPLPPPPIETSNLAGLSAGFDESVTAAHEHLAMFKRLKLPKLFIGLRPAWLLTALTVAIGIVVYLLVPPSLLGVAVDRTDPTWVAIAAGFAFLSATLLLTILYTLASMKLSELFSQIRENVAAAGYLHERWSQLAVVEQRRRQREFEDLQRQREQQLAQQLRRYEAAHQRTLAEIEHRRTTQIQALEADYAERTRAIDAEREKRLQEFDQHYHAQLAELTRSFEDERGRRQTQLDQYAQVRQQSQQQAWDELAGAWFSGIQAFHARAADAMRQSSQRNLAWDELARPTWQPPTEIPEGIRIGQYQVDLAEIEGGVSTLEGLAIPSNTFRLPAALPFPERPSLLLECCGQDGRREAVQAMQVALLRMLTRIPPGKLRLTVIDPVGLGESFSGLMHLADFDELLITSRIWTEMNHIEARLAELTEHMENVLQKYLRNEFSTIEEYNQYAGEVAEPYRVLVVADFPNKFSEQAARRLVSIATSGPRCGVYLLMSTDLTAQMPNAFDLETLEATANTFAWRRIPRSPTPVWERIDWEGEAPAELARVSDRGSAGASPSRNARDLPLERSTLNAQRATSPSRNPRDSKADGAFYAKSPELARWPLILDTPPAPELFTQIVKNVGEASKDIRRVEVSFARIAPRPEEVWSKDSRSGIDIPLGRAGATKLQHLRLGQGTSQHMLVAGKTGSGKSTFFHTLITNVAMHYAPDEVELYLVDFKKGVEFKAYAPESGESRVESPESRIESPVSHQTANSRPSTLNSQLSSLNSPLSALNSPLSALNGLPHARVIAIESDREFGVSVLQRLDAILNERGELFRRAGVQDIAAYRDRLSRESRVESPERSVQSPVSSVQCSVSYETANSQRSTPNSQLSALNAPRSTLNARLPRILLIIDEFQEFFVEDDRYAQQAALLLDRLVRQGRAFGVHVILGSQTLGGAYSLARSTLGQVAVRVALQCSEADAHLILSEENTAARLLTRPGEAIYNDANGLIEGNHPFQIAWLPDAERAGYLAVIQHFARERSLLPPPPVVFEGNIPSDVSRNGELMALIAAASGVRGQESGGRGPESASFSRDSLEKREAAGWDPGIRSPESGDEVHAGSTSAPLQRTADDGPRTPPRIWLGEAVEIGPPTSVTFAPQTGRNLLLVGSDVGAATGILSTALVALAAQQPQYLEPQSPRATPRGSDHPRDEQLTEPPARFYVFDGSPAGSPEIALWRHLTDIVPGVRLVTPQRAAHALEELTAERLRREDQLLGEDLSTPPLFVLIAGVSKFRDLRKSEDDFSLSGFGSSSADQPADPGKQFADLLAGGPLVGMHTLLWSDSYSNVDRWLSRPSLREFELRIAFPMNAADSSNLIDSPAASRLGVHRALLYREETGTFVKFRPYGPPPAAWLDWVHTQLTPRRPLEPATDLEGFHVT